MEIWKCKVGEIRWALRNLPVKVRLFLRVYKEVSLTEKQLHITRPSFRPPLPFSSKMDRLHFSKESLIDCFDYLGNKYDVSSCKMRTEIDYQSHLAGWSEVHVKSKHLLTQILKTSSDRHILVPTFLVILDILNGINLVVSLWSTSCIQSSSRSQEINWI